MTALGNVIRRHRLAKEMSVRDLADAMKISKSAISRYETEEHDLRLSMLNRFADALDTTPSVLLAEAEKEAKKLAQKTKRSDDESTLLESFRNLNRANQEKVLDRMQELSVIQKHKD